ncbi:hypothetical protein QOZ80_6BG0493320 [Eleusine coracana subsp. coracana]|nr:hypothetical protein QOZ80_6BG0493320 [Eleusine coracana subsp. coracana]
MGSCASRSSAATEPISSTAKVVDLDGSMAQFAAPVTAREALAAITGGRGPSSRFLCCSDELYFDAPARALAEHDALRAGQIYFALPLSMLRRPLSDQDMAALAVKASAALGAAPVLVAVDDADDDRVAGVASTSKGKNGGGDAAAAGGKQRRRRRQPGRVAPIVFVNGDGRSTDADGEQRRRHAYGGKGAREAAAVHGGARRLLAVQRLSVIVEAADE